MSAEKPELGIAVGGESINYAKSGLKQGLSTGALNALEVTGEAAEIMQGTPKKTPNQAKSAPKSPSLRPRVVPKDFLGYYPQNKLDHDDAYVEEHKEIFGTDESPLAKDFESIFMHGVRTGGWLGDFDGKGTRAAIARTAEYDDIKHKVDDFSTIYYASPRDGKTHSITIGTDITISSDADVVMEKLTRFTNGGDYFPFGFSRLDYFTDGIAHKSMPLLPRYTIGVSSYDVKDILKNTPYSEQKNALDFSKPTAANAKTRFKVLSEMCAQNDFYLAMEPGKEEREKVLELKSAHSKLMIMRERLNDSLTAAAKDVARYMGLEKPESDAELVSKVEEALLKESQDLYSRRRAESLASSGRVDDKPHFDTYALILESTRELTRRAKNGHLDEFKGMHPRSKKIM